MLEGKLKPEAGGQAGGPAGGCTRHLAALLLHLHPPDLPLPLPFFICGQVKDLVELVQKARMNKILAGLATLQAAITVKLNNLAAMEINAGGGEASFQSQVHPAGRSSGCIACSSSVLSV